MLEIATTQQGTTRTLTLTGRLTIATAEDASAAVADLAGVDRLVIDLAGVEFASSAGLRSLLLAQKAATAQGGSMAVCNVQPAVRALLEATGVIDVLDVE